MTVDERKSETPQCEAYYQELDDWGLYAKKYGHLPEAHDQCPIEISPKEFAEKLERELTAANEQIKRVREALQYEIDHCANCSGDGEFENLNNQIVECKRCKPARSALKC